MSNEHPESVPSCAGEHGRPRGENGPCDRCFIESLCRKLTRYQKTAKEVQARLEKVSLIIKGDVAA